MDVLEEVELVEEVEEVEEVEDVERLLVDGRVVEELLVLCVVNVDEVDWLVDCVVDWVVVPGAVVMTA